MVAIGELPFSLSAVFTKAFIFASTNWVDYIGKEDPVQCLLFLYGLKKST